MPRKPKTPPAELPTIPAELLKQFGDGPMTAEATQQSVRRATFSTQSGAKAVVQNLKRP